MSQKRYLEKNLLKIENLISSQSLIEKRYSQSNQNVFKENRFRVSHAFSILQIASKGL